MVENQGALKLNIWVRGVITGNILFASELCPIHTIDLWIEKMAILLYAIVSKMSMDIGNVIHHMIKLFANNHILSYFFSQLIIALYASVGFIYTKGEILIQPDELLNLTYCNDLISGMNIA